MRYHPSLQYVYGEFVKAMTDMFCLENLSRLLWICSVWRICQGYDGYVLLVLVTMRSSFHFVWRFLTRLARRMSKVEPELHVCQWRAAGLWFSLGTRVSSTNKTGRLDITEIVLKVVLNTITLTLTPISNSQHTLTAIS
jgi:hypothetical protein